MKNIARIGKRIYATISFSFISFISTSNSLVRHKSLDVRKYNFDVDDATGEKREGVEDVPSPVKRREN